MPYKPHPPFQERKQNKPKNNINIKGDTIQSKLPTPNTHKMQDLQDFILFIRNILITQAYSEYKKHMTEIAKANNLSLRDTISADIGEHNRQVWNAVFYELHPYMRYYQLLHHTYLFTEMNNDNTEHYTFLLFDKTLYNNERDNLFYPQETFEEYVQSRIGGAEMNRYRFDNNMASKDGTFKQNMMRKYKRAQEENIIKYGITQHVYNLASSYEWNIRSETIKPYLLYEPMIYLNKIPYLNYLHHKKRLTQDETDVSIDEIHFRTLEDNVFQEIDALII